MSSIPTPRSRQQLVEWLRDYYDETDGEWQAGIAGNCNLVAYNGEDIIGIGLVHSGSRLKYIADLRNMVPELIAALSASSETVPTGRYECIVNGVPDKSKPLSRVDRALNRAFDGPGAELAQRQATELYKLCVQMESEMSAPSAIAPLGTIIKGIEQLKCDGMKSEFFKGVNDGLDRALGVVRAFSDGSTDK